MKKKLLFILFATVISATLSAQQCDYRAIARAAIDTTEKYLYNPAILRTKEWTEFKTRVLDLSAGVTDDNEFRKMFVSNGSVLPFTHFGLVINTPQPNTSSTAGQPEAKPEKFSIMRMNGETVLFTVKTFSASAEEITPYLDTLKAMSFSNLIIDLRDNRGGTIASALPLASYLVNDTLNGGAFLTQKYFTAHSEVPKAASFINLPHFSEASFSQIIKGIHTQEGLCLVVYPAEKTFKGKLYVLTNKNTASTCEPLVYGLKSAKRATVVGEKTMGAMLNGERFTISDRFSLFLPTADFYAADGQRLDRVGVEPDVKVDPADALQKTMDIITGNNNPQVSNSSK
jgi:hypothetical protein